MKTISRKERRAHARKMGIPFFPRYADGLEPRSYKEMYGVGYERFDSKYVKVSDKVSK